MDLEGEFAGGQRRADTPRAAADYLMRLRPVLEHAAGARQALGRSLTSLADDFRREGPMVAERAGAIGAERIETFRALRTQLDGLQPPPACEACQLTLGRWLNRLIDCCDLLNSIGMTRDLTRLHQARALIAEAREYARGFNEEHDRLVDELRDLVDAETDRNWLPIG
jgi:hypothetical protein